MERHDHHPISQESAALKVPLFRSIRLRILLLALTPVLFCAVAIGVLAYSSINATNSMEETVSQQADLYQSLSIPGSICTRLSEYLSTGDPELLLDYQRAAEDFSAFLSQLRAQYPQQPYCQGWVRMGESLLAASRGAAALADQPEEMLSAYQEAAHIQTLLSRFSPYMTKEIEAASTARIERMLSQFMDRVRSDAVILMVILLALILIAILIAHSFIQPLTALTSAVQTLSISIDHTNLSKTRRQDELGILIRVYRDMVKRIRAQMAELQDKQSIERMLQQEKEKNLRAENQLVRSELKVYQSQINSHFLFNAFNTVSRLAYIENAARVQRAVGLIAQFLRNIMTQFDRVVTVEEEFSIVRNFIEIQTLRFGDRIKVEYEMDAGAEWYSVPALTLQPLAENAYRHGLADRKEGFIRCVAEIEENCLRLYTWDDGTGISPQRQKTLRELVTGEDDPTDKDCIGLRNVYRRLELLYPGKVTLILDSQEGAYSQIGFSILIK